MRGKPEKEYKVDELIQIALTAKEEPVEELNRKILNRWKEKSEMKRLTKGKMTAVVTAVCVLFMTVTAAAAARYLTARQVAEQNGNKEIAAAFQAEDAVEINESREAGDYRFTLLGIASGKALIQSDISDSVSDLSGIYAAIAIERLDGRPIDMNTDYSEMNFFISPLIQGLEPWQYNIASMNGGYHDNVIDGVLYRLILCDDIIKFADRKLYLCISNTIFFESAAYHYDEVTGEIRENEEYNGINLLFDLPIDPEKADPVAAEEYLRTLEDSWGQEEEKSEEDIKREEEMQALADIVNLGQEQELLANFELMEEATKIVQEENGSFVYQFSDGEETYAMNFYKSDFQNGKAYMINGSTEGDNYYITLLTENSDQTVTIKTYRMIK